MFDVTQAGSWPRSEGLLAALTEYQAGGITRAEFDKVADKEVRRAVELQEKAGVEIVVDGEQRRDSFVSFVTEKLDGTKLMSLTDTADDLESFGDELAAADVAPDSILNPVTVGELKRREPLAVDELTFVKGLTDKPVKIALPGPYLMIRSMWSPKYSCDHYGAPTEMADDVVGILRDEMMELRDAGCDFVQLDEPVLTEVVFTEDSDDSETFSRKFM
jgi:5-methyltetrahydropteroyltriglutamate--homocysteine methyltransferase